MLEQKREFTVKDGVFRTPILIPSFSSKGFQNELKKIIQYSSELITDEILVSAYDIHHGFISESYFKFPTLIFLDSGGYEASMDTDLSDIQKKHHHPLEWKKGWFDEVLNNWTFQKPTILITYDHPQRRYNLKRQIEIAKKQAMLFPYSPTEILLKPEPGERFLDIPEIVQLAGHLAEFPVIGLTEKELGKSLFERMENIAKIRLSLNNTGMSPPIHIFGSLDPISTPLYFLSGADIFDGLTWLRFGFTETAAIYKHNFGALNLPLGTTDDMVNGHVWNSNYQYITELQGQMRHFLLNSNYEVFGENSNLFCTAHERLFESVGVRNGR